MTTITRRPAGTESGSPVRAWRWTGRAAGYLAGSAFLTGTVLFLLDAAGLLGPGADYRRSGATAYFAHQHHIVWDIAARDTVLPIAFAALMIAGLAIRERTGPASPEGQLVVTSFIVGGILAILADLTFLAATEYWRYTGWPTRAAAAGQTLNGIQLLTHWPEAFGFAILAGGCVALARLCGKHRIFPVSLGVLAYTEAVLLLGIAVTGVIPYNAGYDVLSLAAGAVVGPALGIWLGTALGRPQAQSATDPSPNSRPPAERGGRQPRDGG